MGGTSSRAMDPRLQDGEGKGRLGQYTEERGRGRLGEGTGEREGEQGEGPGVGSKREQGEGGREEREHT